ncbi:MAG TPA: SPOR domain-containing protein [Pyrinomonadaceae bacterium]|jgi:cell division septation protein DedD|nr:SPOR domain-containing protein [Pyrinomonadaceae bacterium]
MSYDFSFNKKTISFALAGFAFVGIMLFIAGLLVGTNWKAEPPAAAIVAAKQPAPAPPAPAPVAAPQEEPVVRAEMARPEVAMPSEADASSGVSAPVKQSHGSAASVNSKRWQSFLPAPPNDGELKIIQEAEPSANDDAETTAFSVQVGVFVAESDAHQLVRQLQKKGYTPIVLAASDKDSKLKYSVRIGAYKNETDAAQAASNIADQEKLTAVVRPLGSL